MRYRLVVLGIAVVAVSTAAVLVVARIPAGQLPRGRSPAGQAPAATVPAGVTLSVDANWLSEPTLYRGWPLVIQVTAEAAGAKEMTLATTGPWSESVTIAVTSSSGAAAAWSIAAVPGAPSSVVLGGLNGAEAAWTVAPDVTRSIAPGTYVIKAELDTTRTAAAGAWKGIARAEPLVVQVIEEPASLTEDDRIWKPLIQSRFAQLRGDPAGALSVVDAWIAANPASVTILERKAELLDAAGRPREALAVVNQALELFYKTVPKGDEPPEALLALQHRLVAKLLK
jgi:hypothetical protein